MRDIGKQLEVYDYHIADVMSEKFVNLAINWSENTSNLPLQQDYLNHDEIAEGMAALQSDYTTHHHHYYNHNQSNPMGTSNNNHNNNNLVKDSEKVNIPTGAMQEPLGQLIHALLQVGRLRLSMEQYTIRLQDSIRLIIRTCLS